MPVEFLIADPYKCNSMDDFKDTEAIVLTRAVTNNHTDRGVAIIPDAAYTGRFKSEEQLQYALQIIEKSRKNFPEARKLTLLKNLKRALFTV